MCILVKKKNSVTFENEFSRSLRKCVYLCEKSRVSVSDKNGRPQGETEMGRRKK